MLSRCQQVRPVTTRSRVVAWAIVALTLGSVNQCVSQDARGVAERSLRFTYKVTISGLFDLVARHMKYDKSRPGYGNGDALWACGSRFGNCTDFHSLFISLARASALPARFEIGFSIPTEPGEHHIAGYHCWAYFLANGQWIPVDISDYDKKSGSLDEFFGKLSADRVAFTTGRDLILEPAQNGEPLNFFIYPHVEVNSQVWPRDRVVTEFTSTSK